ncbi:sugar ABC transporter substrate-binding protein [Candidatus Roizmanbacteria bacterium]|nr:sugar ABC transporter substrate-binding protein [Candidatus Roizmanbacteria bacterium]
MATEQSSQDIFQAPQSVEPELPTEGALEPALTIEGYEPPPQTPSDELPPPPGASGFNKRIIIVIILSLLILGGMAWFISRMVKSDTPEGSVTMTYWGLWEEEAVIKPIIDEYKRAHPNVTIEYKLQSLIQYRERLAAALERGEGPDIFRFHNTWVPMLRSVLAPVPQDVLSPAQIQDTYYPVVQRDLYVNNKFYGIPLEIDGLVLYYNKDLLTEKGVSTPRTWNEFEEAAQALTVKDGFGAITTAGAAMGTAENVEHFSDILGLLLFQNGTDFSLLTSDPAEQALTYYTLFAQPPNNVWDAQQDNSIVAFAGGKVAFMFAPSWQVFAIESLNPSLHYGVAGVPQLPGATPVSWATYWVEGVSAKSIHQNEAFAFLQYISSKETLAKLYTEISKTRKFGEPYPRLDMAGELSTHEQLGPVIVQAPQMRSWYLASRTQDNGINDKIINYFKDAVNAVEKGSSPRGALDTAARGVEQVLKEYGLNK